MRRSRSRSRTAVDSDRIKELLVQAVDRMEELGS
jgi:hypothetical protein